MKKTISLLALAAVLSLAGLSARAQEFKAPIRLIVPYGAGGSTDVMARAVAPTLSRELGQPVIVENKPGANGQIGTQYVKTAPGDGTVFLFTLDHSVVIVPLVTPNVPYSVKDFLPVGKAGRFQWVFATPLSGPAGTLPEFIELARKDPAFRNFGVAVMGGPPQVMGDAISRKAGVEMTVLPFAGAAPLMPLVMGGQIAAGVVGVAEGISMQKGGRVRLLGISGSRRYASLPDVPTFAELDMPGVQLGTLYSVFAPLSLPLPMAQRFNRALRLAVEDPKLVERAHDMSIELESSASLEDAAKELHDIAVFWEKAMKPH
jgi:tripartite-type tricarboxylate transporter receptor subunit TctC